MLDVVSPQEAQDILTRKTIDNDVVKNEDTTDKTLIIVSKLPSGFKGYPEGTKISYEPITLGELEAINSGDEVDITRSIALLLKSIHCNTIPVDDLYYWDVMYIGIQRKLLAFGDTVGVTYAQCPNCGNIIKKEFDYTELAFKEIEAQELPVITSLQDTEVEIGLITIKDFLEIDTDKGELDVYARMIKNLPYEESYKLLSKCTGRDAKKIKYIDKLLNYGLLPFIEKCDAEIPNPEYKEGNKKKVKKTIPCGTEVRVEVRSPFEVVFPEDNLTDDFDSEIRFGR